MKRLFVLASAASLTLFVFAVFEVRAEPIRWGYDAGIVGLRDNPPPGSVFSSNHRLSGDALGYIVGHGGFGSLNDPSTYRTGYSIVPLLTLEGVDNDFEGVNPVFDHAGYQLTVFLRDDLSGELGQLNFFGEFNGILTPSTADIWVLPIGHTGQYLTLGNHQYAVSVRYDPISPPGTIQGRMSAEVSVGLAPVPEPATLALAGLGVCLLGGAACARRWPRASPANAA